MEFTLAKDKTTPGTIRFKETGDAERPLVIYLLKDQVADLGNPESITVDIQKES